MRAYQGGTYYIKTYDDTTPFTTTSVTISSSSAHDIGGSYVILGATTQTMTFTSLTIFTSQSVSGNGGLFYVNNAV